MHSIKAQQKAWREAYPDKIRAYHCKHAAKPEVKARKKEFERANKERINVWRRELYILHRPLPREDETISDAEALAEDNATPAPVV